MLLSIDEVDVLLHDRGDKLLAWSSTEDDDEDDDEDPNEDTVLLLLLLLLFVAKFDVVDVLRFLYFSWKYNILISQYVLLMKLNSWKANRKNALK